MNALLENTSQANAKRVLNGLLQEMHLARTIPLSRIMNNNSPDTQTTPSQKEEEQSKVIEL